MFWISSFRTALSIGHSLPFKLAKETVIPSEARNLSSPLSRHSPLLPPLCFPNRHSERSAVFALRSVLRSEESLFAFISPLATSPHRSVSRTVIPSEARFLRSGRFYRAWNLSFLFRALCVLRVLCVNSFSSFELSTFNFQPLYLRFSILCDVCVKFLLPRRSRFPAFFAVALL